ncbi:MAG: hypothetical protein ACJ797_08240 [Ktedonobacteraceae bacterium]
MNSSIFFGGSVLAAVIAGAIALFAPCCISVMLPAYFASSFQNRRLLVARKLRRELEQRLRFMEDGTHTL